MDLVARLVERHFSGSKEELRIGGLPISMLVQRYGTPLFAYDRGVLQRQLACLRQVLPRRFAIYYSAKANPNPAILKFFLERGCGIEVASAGEFQIALAAGCAPQQIVFAGPGKTEAELELVLGQNIGEIHVESLLEIERVGFISRRLGVRADVAVRVNPTAEAAGGAMLMGGKSAPFGVDEENLRPVVDQLVSDSHLCLRGIHLFVGTQILDYSVLLSQYCKGLEIARRVAGWLNQPLHTLDFGGGLGIPYFSSDRELDLEALSRGLYELQARIHDDPLLAHTRFIIEPGRFLVGEAGIYITRINDIKVSRGKKFLIVDGGLNHHLAASGNLGQTIKRNFPVALLNKLGGPIEETVDVVGPLCTPLDVLARGLPLPRAEVGDLVGVFQSGAYARSASPLGFLSHATPPEVWACEGTACLLRRRGEFEDYLRDICPPCQDN